MSLHIASLNSGSNGNSYYIGNNREAVLIDAGISCRELERRMKQLELDIRKIRAVFISHEHTDHIRGIRVLSSKYQLPVYTTDSTLKNCSLQLDAQRVHYFTADNPVGIGALQIHPFSKKHDAADPYSFMICCNGTRVGIFTDIGSPCDKLVHYFSQCHAAFLETNYDEDMLENGRYPYYLKQRIRGGWGHLSNSQALELFIKYRPSYMSHLFLSHLSQDNNCPKLVKELFIKNAGTTEIIVAGRHEPTRVYPIQPSTTVKAGSLSETSLVQLQLNFS